MVKNINHRWFFFFSFILMSVSQVKAQEKYTALQIRVDKNGVMRNRATGKAVSFFGVNYTLPFAFDYRAIKKIDKNPKKEIRQDVYHFARLGFDAFRVHLWDTEISDSLGNVRDSKHLKLFDYLVSQLEKRGIKTIITPLNFYNNGYPQKPTSTQGFANYISKGEAPKNEKYWPVLERYFKQLVNHVNPYTGKTYQQDPNIIGLEIVNEPSHGGKLQPITHFINVMANHIRSDGWEKPIFYNISQNPGVTKAVMNANVDGVSFQWYPAGLVGGKGLRGNYLPYVDTYNIPFKNKKAFQSKAQMVYEFSSADYLKSYVYPAMARSFRSAGFQWATQFTYTPMFLAYCNADYQTHYLNLAYTPSKAISMKIASAAFHQLSRSKNYGHFPADTTFGNFSVSPQRDLSIMNTDTAFYYSNTTKIQPRKPAQLKHIAGVGSSPVVTYHGRGTYFLDKLDDGIWRLEVMPDAIHITDPFKTPNLHKWLTRIEWHRRPMQIHVNGLGRVFRINGLNKGNNTQKRTDDGSFGITPGAYLLIKKGKESNKWTAQSRMGLIRLGEFVAPKSSQRGPFVRHTPKKTVTAENVLPISATIAGLQPTDSVHLVIQSGFQPQKIAMKQESSFHYQAVVSAKQVHTGLLKYWIVVDEGDKAVTFPGNHYGKPSDWDYYYKDYWQSYVVDKGAPLALFNAKKDVQDLNVAFPFWSKDYSGKLISADDPNQFSYQILAQRAPDHRIVLGASEFIGDKISGRKPVAEKAQKLVIKAKAVQYGGADLKVILVEENGSSFSASVPLSSNYENHQVALASFQPDSCLLLPRPFPGFQSLWFKSGEISQLDPGQLEKIQFIVEPGKSGDVKTGFGAAIESAWLQ